MSGSTEQFSAFKHKSYQRYFASRFLTAFSIQLLSTAVGFHVYALTKDPIWLGWIGLVQFLPGLILVVFTGMAADRFSRRKVMASSIILLGLCAGVISFMGLTGRFVPLWVMVVLTFVGIGRAFHSPASSSLAVNLVPKEDFANAIGWITSSWQLAIIVGPAMGGVLFHYFGSVTYVVGTLALVLSAGLILSIPKPSQIIKKERTSLRTLLGGFEYIWKTKIVFGAITLDLFAILLGGAVALMPVYAEDILNIGSTGNGLLRAAPGIGAIIMLIFLTRFPVRDHAGKILLVSVALFGAATVVFGASKLAWLSILALMLVGAFDMISVYIREILLQLWTPDEVRGRVNAVNSIFLGASNELGEARAGFMAAIWGSVFTVVAGGIAAIGIVGLVSVIFPSLKKIRKLDVPEHLKESEGAS